MAIVQVWVTVSTTTYITRKMSLRGLSFARSGLTASLDVAGAASLRSRPFSCSGCHAYNRYPFKKQTDRKSTIRHQAQKDLERDAALAPSRAESSRRAQLPRLTVTRSSRRSIPESAFRSAPGNRRPMSTMATAEAVSSPTEDSAIQAMIIASESSTTEETPRPSPGPHPKKVKAKKKNGPADRALEAVLSGAAPAQDTEGQDSVNEPESTEKPEVVAQSTLRVDDITIREIMPSRKMTIARLRDPLQRVLFSPGVHWLRDPRTGTWNYPSDLDKIPQPEEFAFHRCPQYIHPSGHKELAQLAARNRCRFVGSSSTLTKSLSHIYFALSGGRGVNLENLSQAFGSEASSAEYDKADPQRSDFTSGAEMPAVINIGTMAKGIRYVDSDKSFDTDNVLSEFGVVLEKFLTSEQDDFARFLSTSPESGVSEEERTAPEAYRYQKVGKLLMRSQLDCQDPRLPGDGVFDIKTRACVPIRHDRGNYIANSVYNISKEKGLRQSYERELYELARSGMLKYSLQVRIGAMDGIFLAYHNTKRIFGFQYLPLAEMDALLFGSTEMGDRVFKLCVGLLNVLLNRISRSFEGPVRAFIKQSRQNSVSVFTQPIEWDEESQGQRPTKHFQMSLESIVNGEVTSRPIDHPDDIKTWDVNYRVTAEPDTAAAAAKVASLQRGLKAMNDMYLPEGKTAQDMQAGTGIRWREANERVKGLRLEAIESGAGYAARQLTWKEPANAWAKI